MTKIQKERQKYRKKDKNIERKTERQIFMNFCPVVRDKKSKDLIYLHKT